MNLTKINGELLKMISGSNNLAKTVTLSASREIILTDTFGEGVRHERLLKIAGSLSRQGLSLETLTKTLLRLNEILCNPTLPSIEVIGIAESTDAYKNYERNPDLSEDIDAAVRVRNKLHSNKGNINQKYQEISDIIIKDLCSKGKFFQTLNQQYYYFDNTKKVLLLIERESMDLKVLFGHYYLNPQMPAYKFVFEGLKIYANENGFLTNVYKYAHYDTVRNILYVKHSDSDMYKITVKDVQLCPNGTDNVLFTNLIPVESYDYIYDMPTDYDYISELIISLCNFDESTVPAAVQARLAYTYLISLIMPEFLGTKPILTGTGTKGSAKTTFMKCASKVYYGSKASVSAMPNKLDDLDILVVNSHFLSLDNVDSYQKGISDKFAVYATGGIVKKRKLYTDNEVFEAELDAFLAITTRTLFFKRDDVLQRIILLSLKPIQGGYMAEDEVLRPVIENRNNIITQIINEAQNVMRRVATGKYNNYKSDFRMADFARFMAILMNNPKDVEDDLRVLTNIQRAKCIENDIIMPYLLAFTHYFEGKFYSAQDIFVVLEGDKIYTAVGIPNRDYFVQSYPNIQSFAKRLNNIKDDIADYIIVTTTKGAGNITLYRFEKGEHFSDLPMVHLRMY